MKDRSVWRCQQCGFASPKPGTCPDCKRATGELMALVEERAARTAGVGRMPLAPSRPRPLREVSLERTERLRTGIGELDRVLGGGVVPGSLVCPTPRRPAVDPGFAAMPPGYPHPQFQGWEDTDRPGDPAGRT